MVQKSYNFPTVAGNRGRPRAIAKCPEGDSQAPQGDSEAFCIRSRGLRRFFGPWGLWLWARMDAAGRGVNILETNRKVCDNFKNRPAAGLQGGEAPHFLRPRPLWVSLHCAAPSTRSWGIVVEALLGVNPEAFGAKIRRFWGQKSGGFWGTSFGNLGSAS